MVMIMKKIMILILIMFMAGCQTTTVPNFVGETLTSAVGWGKDNDVEINISSEYSDFNQNIVISQDVEAGTDVNDIEEINIIYSRGLNPEGVIELPDFGSMNEETLISWLKDNEVKNYEIVYAFVDGDETVQEYTVDSDGLVKRSDEFTFTFALGGVEMNELTNNNNAFYGVNLGGWFVLEGWMTPELFTGVNGSDETVFMQQKPEAELRIKEHYETFITKDDLIYLKSIGVEYVRLPIPWWLYGELAYVGTELEVQYANSVDYIHQALTWMDELNMNVLLDLHTAPGGQNGFDNGGLTGVQEWGKNEEETGYVQMTVDVLGRITDEFSSHSSVYGIEVLNEPAWAVNMETLQNFYVDAYNLIRSKNADITIGFHDGFRSYEKHKWFPFFEENGFENVFIDMHLYHVFGDDWADKSLQEHLEVVKQNESIIKEYQEIVDVVVGEWSLALPNELHSKLDASAQKQAKQIFAIAQMNSYNEGAGWYFWSYKIDRNSHLEWDMRRSFEAELLPRLK